MQKYLTFFKVNVNYNTICFKSAKIKKTTTTSIAACFYFIYTHLFYRICIDYTKNIVSLKITLIIPG